ncbi:phage baseplate assembly protein V [Streptosporangium sp. NPDC000509]|uniref:phage baseplate assembly protein V n=1 Tax=Streptosporangium sp. NPDC000509 TaxID=3366186 RepID=UPI0036C744DE
MDAYSALTMPPGTDERFFGVVIGIVTNNKDPDGLGRVKASLPWMGDQVETDWARVVAPMAGSGRGVYFLPEVDDEVLVAFEHGNPDTPYVLGGLWNGQDKPPESNSDGKNDLRTIRSRSGNVIRLSDADGDAKIEIIDGSTKNKIVICTKDNSITITAAGDVTIQSSGGKLKLSGNGVEITSTSTVKIEAGQKADVTASGQLNLKGSQVNIN